MSGQETANTAISPIISQSRVINPLLGSTLHTVGGYSHLHTPTVGTTHLHANGVRHTQIGANVVQPVNTLYGSNLYGYPHYGTYSGLGHFGHGGYAPHIDLVGGHTPVLHGSTVGGLHVDREVSVGTDGKVKTQDKLHAGAHVGYNPLAHYRYGYGYPHYGGYGHLGHAGVNHGLWGHYAHAYARPTTHATVTPAHTHKVGKSTIVHPQTTTFHEDFLNRSGLYGHGHFQPAFAMQHGNHVDVVPAVHHPLVHRPRNIHLDTQEVLRRSQELTKRWQESQPKQAEETDKADE